MHNHRTLSPSPDRLHPAGRFRSGLLTALLLASFLLNACSSTLLPTTSSIVTLEPTSTPRRTTPVPTRVAATPTATPAPLPRIEVDPAALQGVTVELWHPWEGPAAELLQRQAQEFSRSNEWGLAVKLTYQGTYDELYAAVDTALEEAEALPDVVVGYPYQLRRWDAERPLVDLSAYLQDPEWGLSAAEQDDFYPAFWGQDLDGERRLGIPAQRTAQALYYNRSMARRLGFDAAPVTPEQFRQQACASVQANLFDDDPANDHKGGYIVSTHPSAVLAWIYAFGGEVTTERQSYRFNSPEAASAFSFLRKMLDETCAWQTELPTSEGEFASGWGLFAVGSATGVAFQEEAMRVAGNTDEWTVLPFPARSGEPVVTAYGPSYGVLVSSPEEQLAAWLFLRWLSSTENQARLAAAQVSLPLRAAALVGAVNPNSPWEAALQLAPQARPEPPYASWSTVRWALNDAATQLYRYYFTADQVPSLLKLLDSTANEMD